MRTVSLQRPSPCSREGNFTLLFDLVTKHVGKSEPPAVPTRPQGSPHSHPKATRSPGVRPCAGCVLSHPGTRAENSQAHLCTGRPIEQKVPRPLPTAERRSGGLGVGVGGGLLIQRSLSLPKSLSCERNSARGAPPCTLMHKAPMSDTEIFQITVAPSPRRARRPRCHHEDLPARPLLIGPAPGPSLNQNLPAKAMERRFSFLPHTPSESR